MRCRHALFDVKRLKNIKSLEADSGGIREDCGRTVIFNCYLNYGVPQTLSLYSGTHKIWKKGVY
jgi:hypothetical protein